MLDKYINIGFTKKAYGSRGQIKVVIHDQFVEDFAQSEHVFITLMGKPAPFFIEEIDVTGDILLKVDDINSPEDAKRITSKDLFLRESDLTTLSNESSEENQLEFAHLIGYVIIDSESGEIGRIKEIQEFPQQEIAIVTYQSNDIFIPLHPDLIESLDQTSKKITLRLPEGLLDL